ncbi:hypothetical protein F5Y16DRAFT_160865 [Xylariaceae sp. FL0255]|nr:hypothetical protein F5Y16DRAFT_160865 [Xylariaceae sp. FL0255]
MAPPWFRIVTPLYKNTGSVARDHLASERTFLAWMRTGLGFVALGIAIERFSQLDLSELIPDHHHNPYAATSPSLPASLPPATAGSTSPATTTASEPSPSPEHISKHLELEKRKLDLARRHLALKEDRQAEKQAEKHAAQLQVGVLLSLGAGSILYGATRYFGNLRHLERGEFRPAYHGVAVVAAAVAGLGGGVYGSAIRRLGERDRERVDL